MFDRGHGPALVVVQGVHGRWEWMKPALVELAGSCRTISYSLSRRHRIGRTPGPGAGLRQLSSPARRRARSSRARHKSRSAASRSAASWRCATPRPGRIESPRSCSPPSPAPGWKPNPQQARWLARPWMSAPAFRGHLADARLAGSAGRASRRGHRGSDSSCGRDFAPPRAPMIPSLMAERIRLAQQTDFAPDCARVKVPTLVLTGEEPLDRVVPVASTRSFCTLDSRRRVAASSNARDISASLPSRRRFARRRRKLRSCPQSLISSARRGAWKPCSTRPRPAAVRAAVVFAHPHPQYGGTMHTKAVYQGAKALTRIGCAVLRFNFRGVGASEGAFDQRRRRAGGLPRRARLHGGALSGRAALGRRLLVRIVGGARGRRRSTTASRS